MSESQQKPGQYNSWTIYPSGFEPFTGPVAFNSRMDSDGIVVPLRKDSDIVKYAGSWGNRFEVLPNKEETVIRSGVCLFDGRWRVKFPTGGERRLVLGMDKGEALIKLDAMQRAGQVDPVRLSIPVGLRRDYHEAVIKWQAKMISSLPDGMTILYTIPITEYMMYLDDLKPYVPANIMQEQIDGLNDLGKIIKDMVTATFVGKKVMFVDPMNEKPEIVTGIQNLAIRQSEQALDARDRIGVISSDVASFLAPYVYPSAWVKGANRIIGVEDITELRLAYTANALNSQIARMLEVCVPAIPDQYSSKEPSDPKREVSFVVEKALRV